MAEIMAVVPGVYAFVGSGSEAVPAGLLGEAAHRALDHRLPGHDVVPLPGPEHPHADEGGVGGTLQPAHQALEGGRLP